MTGSSSSPPVINARVAPRTVAHVALGAAALLSAVPFLIPVHRFVLPTFYPEAIALGLGLVVVLVVGAGFRGAGEFQVPRLAVLFVLFAMVVYGQSFFVVIPYREHAELWMWYLLWAAALILAGRVLGVRMGADKVVPVLATAITIGALLSAGAGLAQWLKVSDSLSPLVAVEVGGSEQITGNFLQKNLFANYLVLGIASAAYLWRIRQMGTPALIATLTIMTFVLQLAASRASLLMLAGFTIALAIWRWRAGPSSRGDVNRWLCAILLVWGILFLSIQLAQIALESGPGLDASNALPGRRLTNSQELFQDAPRLFLAEKAWSIFLSSPWVGVGAGGFVWQYYSLETVWLMSAGAESLAGLGADSNAHNIVLHFLAEFGLVGLFFLCMFAVMSIRDMANQVQVRNTPELVWIAAVVLAETLHSLVEFPLWHAHFLGLAALALGVSAQRLDWQPRWNAARLVLAGFALGGAGMVAIHWVAYHQLLSAAQLSRTTGVIIVSDLGWIRNTLLRPYLDVGIALSFVMDRQDLDRKLEFNGRIMRFLPLYRLVHNQIMLLTIAGREKEARTLLDRTQRVDKFHFANLEKSLVLVPATEIPADSWLRAAARARP